MTREHFADIAMRACQSGDPQDLVVALDAMQSAGLGLDMPAVEVTLPSGRVQRDPAVKWSAAEYAGSRFGQTIMAAAAESGMVRP